MVWVVLFAPSPTGVGVIMKATPGGNAVLGENPDQKREIAGANTYI
jgi:hypothetical protein